MVSFSMPILWEQIRVLFFPSTAKFLIIFISWLNLEIGIDTCFFEGMDTYWKMQLQLAFPANIIVLVVAVIVLSNWSLRFSQIIGRKNPVTTLATLILLSYTTFLKTIIEILSYSTLNYPDGSQQTVWLPDATVPYLSGKHAVLFAAAIITLIAGIAYTSLLISWQWLLHCNIFLLLRCIKDWVHRITPNLSYTYKAKYLEKYRLG